jgi:hypothetical protein
LGSCNFVKWVSEKRKYKKKKRQKQWLGLVHWGEGGAVVRQNVSQEEEI